MMTFLRNACIVLAHLALLALALCAPATRAENAAEPWSGMAHTAFRHQTETAFSFGTVFAQDRTGFIWLGTQNGLVRWDGVRMRRYVSDASVPGSLPDSYILSLLVDRDGRLWVGTSSGGLARYDAARDAFVTIGVGAGGLSHARATALADDGSGGIWVGTARGLERVGADGRVYAAASGAPQIAGTVLLKGGISMLLRDRAGTLWIGTRQGLYQRRSGRLPLEAVALTAPGTAEPAITSLYQDGSGRVWIGTRAHGAFAIDAQGHAHQVLGAHRRPAVQGEQIFSMVEKLPGILWFGTEGGGIVEFDPAHGQIRRIRHQSDATDSLYDDEAVAMFRERSGQIFVATSQAMSVHDPRPQGFLTIRFTGTDGIKMSAHQILVRPDGRVWIATIGGAVKIVDPLHGQIGEILPRADITGGGLAKGRVQSMVNGPDGSVYLGTQQGLFVSDGDGGRIRRVAIPTRADDAPVGALAYRDGTLWVGGLDGVWVMSLDRVGAKALLRHEDTLLGDMRVSAILPLDDGSAWIGTRAGLARMPADNGAVELLPTDAGDTTRVAPGYISSLALDRQGRLWLSTYGRGVAMLERTDASGRRWFRRLGVSEGLPDNGVNALVTERDGSVWLSTDNGLARIAADTLAIRKLGASDGMHIPTYWFGSRAQASNGDILFGGLTGITVVRPARMVQRHDIAPLAVTGIMLGGRKLPEAPFNLGAKAPSPLTLAPDDRERGFSLEYTALDFAFPRPQRYSYRLAGFDRNWIDTENALRPVSYTNLAPGNYTLQLRKGDADGAAPVRLDVPVRVLPAWHQQDWVRALALLALLGFVVGVVQARTALLRRHKRELEATVATRTAELRATQTHLETMAYSDPLTGLPNRRLFTDEIRRMAVQAQRDGVPFTLLLIDLDHFKEINDTFGHDAGDALLVEAADRLRSAVREGDRVARLGGDEFAVLLAPFGDTNVGGVISQRIVDDMARPIMHHDVAMRVSASVGGAAFFNQQDVDSLYKAADLALYQAKSAGRNTWRMEGVPRKADLPL